MDRNQEGQFWEAPSWLKQKSRPEIFDTIYREGIWGGGSGGGSSAASTIRYRSFLITFFRNKQVRSVLDIGCGDWELSRLVPWDNIRYVGADIVPNLIDENRKKYGAPNIEFIRMDAVEDDWPDAELVILKDVLQHLSNLSVSRILRKVRNYRYALITNDYAEKNLESEDGDTRPLNLRAPPFNLYGECAMAYGAKEVLLYEHK